MCETFEKLPSPGDIVFTNRGLYKHYGVYICHNSVIHFAGPKGHETDASMADIIKTSLEDFLRGDLLEIQEDGDIAPLSRREIIRRAESLVGKCKGDTAFFSTTASILPTGAATINTDLNRLKMG